VCRCCGLAPIKTMMCNSRCQLPVLPRITPDSFPSLDESGVAHVEVIPPCFRVVGSIRQVPLLAWRANKAGNQQDEKQSVAQKTKGGLLFRYSILKNQSLKFREL
jgi:hypothetical protein